MAGRIILETARLYLREFDEDDAADFLPLCSDPQVIRYTGDVGIRTLEEAREGLRTRSIADYRKHGFGRWACVLKPSGRLIGFAGLKYLDELGEVDLGYRFLPDCWGQGLATEASRPAIAYGFERLRLPRILGLVEPANVASVRVLEKLDMRYVGQQLYFGKDVARYEISSNERNAPG